MSSSSSSLPPGGEIDDFFNFFEGGGGGSTSSNIDDNSNNSSSILIATSSPSAYLDYDNYSVGGGYYDDFAYFTTAQYVILFVIGLFSSLLSLAGSSIILWLIIKGRKLHMLYHQLLFGLSVSDLLMTFTLILQPLLVPSETNYIFAIGNERTCSFVGFGYLFFVASYFYNFLLAIYFLVIVRYKAAEQSIKKYMGWWCHIIAFGMPVSIGITALKFNLINVNPFLGVCSLFPTNHECTWKDDVTCENDSQHSTLNSVLDFYAMGLVGIGLICTGAVYWTVKRKFKVTGQAQQRSSSSGATTTTRSTIIHLSDNQNEDDDDDDEAHDAIDDNVESNVTTLGSTVDNVDNDDNTDNNDTDAQKQRIRSIAIQAVCYAGAYFVGLIVVLAANVVDSFYLKDGDDDLTSLGDSGIYFFVVMLLWLLFPLQGFLNMLVYIRPRLVRWKRHYEDASWWFAFQKVLSNEVPPRWGAPTVTLGPLASNNRGGSSTTRSSKRKKNSKKQQQGSSTNGSSSKKQQQQQQQEEDFVDAMRRLSAKRIYKQNFFQQTNETADSMLIFDDKSNDQKNSSQSKNKQSEERSLTTNSRGRKPSSRRWYTASSNEVPMSSINEEHQQTPPEASETSAAIDDFDEASENNEESFNHQSFIRIQPDGTLVASAKSTSKGSLS